MDTKSDLNVYTDLESTDGGELAGDANRQVRPGATCFTSKLGEAGVFTGAEAVAIVGETSCCSAPRQKTESHATTPWNLADIDINEWAGKCSNSYAFLLLTSSRIVQDLRSQDVIQESLIFVK